MVLDYHECSHIKNFTLAHIILYMTWIFRDTYVTIILSYTIGKANILSKYQRLIWFVYY